MPQRRPRLTKELVAQIVSGIRAGVYAHVAAASRGVSGKIYLEWLARGQCQGAREPYASFAAEVETAQAQARLRAEMETFIDDPRGWLLHGPGKETADSLGWSSQVQARVDEAEERANPLLHEPVMAMFRHLLKLLVPYPEVREKVLGLYEQAQQRGQAA
jgi:hypothetical protein